MVLEKSSSQLKPCQFPFIMQNKTFFGCTDFKDKNKKLWCSTKVTKDGYHVGKKGFWGHCNTCKIDSQVSEEAVVSNVDNFVQNNLNLGQYL